jgi:hypothetical protein
MLRRYWFEFDLSNSGGAGANWEQGCGVTAFDDADATDLLKDRVFNGCDLPPIRNVIEDVDVSTLDDKYVRPNMDIPVFRGVWFPMGDRSRARKSR